MKYFFMFNVLPMNEILQNKVYRRIKFLPLDTFWLFSNLFYNTTYKIHELYENWNCDKNKWSF